MNEENNSGTELKIIESEVELGERRTVGENNLIKEINSVMMTDITPRVRYQYLEKIINHQVI